MHALQTGPEPEAYIVGDLVKRDNQPAVILDGIRSLAPADMIRFAVLISGRGSNMTYLADAIKDYSIAAKITVVISNRCCAGITLAQDRGLPTRVIKRKSFNTQFEHEAAIAAAIHYHRSKYIF